MFWKKNTQSSRGSQEQDFPHPYRFCNLFISDKYKQILFVPMGKIEIGAHAEVDNLIIDEWPCKFQNLEKNIEETLMRYLPKMVYIKGKWPSYNNSKAKSQKSFESDYIRVRLETDLTRSYGDGEVERINVTTQPTLLDNTYQLIGGGHLLDAKVAQIVIDVVEACFKIRNN